MPKDTVPRKQFDDSGKTRFRYRFFTFAERLRLVDIDVHHRTERLDETPAEVSYMGLWMR